jgi:Flp pilus assembly protein TadG
MARRRRRERGAAAVEMAIVLPLLVLLLGGVIDFGWLFFNEIMLANAAREGARGAIVELSDADVKTRAAEAAKPLPGPVTTSDVTVVTNCLSSTSTDAKVTVRPATTFSWFFLGAFGIPTPTVQGSATMGCV